MDAKSRQQALDNISAEELAKIKAHQASTEGAQPVDNEWMLLAEFAKAFGWQAYLDVKNDEIKIEEMLTLLEAHRKLEYVDMFKNAHTSFVGSGSAQSKKPSQTFKKLTKGIINQTKVQE